MSLKLAKFFTKFIIVDLLIGLVTVGFFVPNFMMVFLVPAGVLVFFQSVSIWCNQRNAKIAFAFGQLFNYAIIGVVVGGISIYLHNADQAISLNAEKEFEDAVEMLPNAEEEAALAEIKSMQSSIRSFTIDESLLSECRKKRFVEEGTRVLNDLLDENDYVETIQPRPFGCNTVLEISDMANLRSIEAEQAIREVKRLTRIVDAGGIPNYSINTIIPNRIKNELLLLYFPMLLLSSVIFNLVRTIYTHSLITSGWLRPRNQID